MGNETFCDRWLRLVAQLYNCSSFRIAIAICKDLQLLFGHIFLLPKPPTKHSCNWVAAKTALRICYKVMYMHPLAHALMHVPPMH